MSCINDFISMLTGTDSGLKAFLEGDEAPLDAKHAIVTAQVGSDFAFSLGSTNGFANELGKPGAKWTRDGYDAFFGEAGRWKTKRRMEAILEKIFRQRAEWCENCSFRLIRWCVQAFIRKREFTSQDIWVDSDDSIKLSKLPLK